jgi:hypothetical protein
MDNFSKNTLPTREAVERGLAIVGFVALIAFGIWLAVYSSRYVPDAVERLGAAAVALTSVFVPGEPSLSVVPTTTLPFDEEPLEEEETPTTSVPETPATTEPTPGEETSNEYQIGGGSTGVPTLSGLPDLTANIIAVGYLAGASTDTFIATTTVPSGFRPAVKFAIENTGTNIAQAGWRFTAALPTQSAYVFSSDPQQALNPGDRIEYVLGFDQASPGSNRSISIAVDSTSAVGESNETNNGATGTVTILGS